MHFLEPFAQLFIEDKTFLKTIFAQNFKCLTFQNEIP